MRALVVTATKATRRACHIKPGSLFKATDAIAKRGVNIEGYCVSPSGKDKEGIFHFVTSDPNGARKALEDVGFTVREELDAFAVKIQDRPGALASVLRPSPTTS